MSLERLLYNISSIRSRVREGSDDVLLVCGSRQEVDEVGDDCAISLDGVEVGCAMGRTIGTYAITPLAVEKIVYLSLSEIQNLKLKVKTLEQKLQAIDDVLKGGNV